MWRVDYKVKMKEQITQFVCAVGESKQKHDFIIEIDHRNEGEEH